MWCVCGMGGWVSGWMDGCIAGMEDGVGWWVGELVSWAVCGVWCGVGCWGLGSLWRVACDRGWWVGELGSLWCGVCGGKGDGMGWSRVGWGVAESGSWRVREYRGLACAWVGCWCACGGERWAFRKLGVCVMCCVWCVPPPTLHSTYAPHTRDTPNLPPTSPPHTHTPHTTDSIIHKLPNFPSTLDGWVGEVRWGEGWCGV